MQNNTLGMQAKTSNLHIDARPTKQAVKSITQRIAAATGFMMLLATSALADFDSPIGVVIYLTVTVALLAYGRTFDFQNR